MKLKRRAFLESSWKGALALAGAGVGATTAASSTWSTAPAPARNARANISSFELDELTLQDLQAGLQSGRFSARSLVKKYLGRIEAIDRRGPSLHSVLEVNPDALALADALDQERKAKGPRGPLHGIPVLIKDNIDTGDRMMTTAGSLALLGSRAARDAFLVERLRECGVVILGKTNLSEWANFRGARSTSGWSGRGGQTCNPYALDRNPSGSSSGSAVAVAASLCAVAVGTETDGSILSPSSYNGIVGLKPTVGLISRSGIIPISSTQDTAGPMARSVTDAAILLGAMTGQDARDSATERSVGHGARDYTRFLDPHGLKGARLGVLRKWSGFPDRVRPLIETILDELKRQGAELIDPVDLNLSPDLSRAESEVMHFEFKAGLNAYLAALGPRAPVHSLRELIAFNERHREEELGWFGQETLIEAETKGPLTEKSYLEAVAASRRLAGKEGLDAILEKHRLDAIVAPTRGPAHVTDLVFGDRGTGWVNLPAPAAGYPCITVPAGQLHGLPVGFSFAGPAWSEPTLLKIAFAFEQATKARGAPRYRSAATAEA